MYPGVILKLFWLLTYPASAYHPHESGEIWSIHIFALWNRRLRKVINFKVWRIKVCNPSFSFSNKCFFLASEKTALQSTGGSSAVISKTRELNCPLVYVCMVERETRKPGWQFLDFKVWNCPDGYIQIFSRIWWWWKSSSHTVWLTLINNIYSYALYRLYVTLCLSSRLCIICQIVTYLIITY